MVQYYEESNISKYQGVKNFTQCSSFGDLSRVVFKLAYGPGCERKVTDS